MDAKPSDGHRPSETMSSSPQHSSATRGPFALRTLLDNVPLTTDETPEDVKITCVDYLDHNLYVGTSAAELLHFVQIPFDSSDGNGRPTFILASRLRPVFSEAHSAPVSARPGVQQILLLPKVGKACILCNWTVTFYSLPELSPVFGTTQVRNCNWIGGVDLNIPMGSNLHPRDQRGQRVIVLLSLNRRIQVVRIGEEAGAVKNIDFAGSTISCRRGNIACVADSRHYALLDVEHQLKIPLMAISSLDNSQPPGELGHTQSIAATNETGLLRSNSSAHSRTHSGASQHHAHARSTSLGAFIAGAGGMLGPRQGEEPINRQPTPPSKPTSPKPPDSANKPLPSTPGQLGPPSAPTTPVPAGPAVAPKPPPPYLKPHIVSPSPEEFLLVTGTTATDPAIGMFVNLDGDPKGPTLGFDRYPREVVVDVGFVDAAAPKSPRLTMGEDEVEKYVLASMTKDSEDGVLHGLEVQRFDGDPDSKFWLEAPLLEGQERQSSWPLGIRSLAGSDETICQELIDRLCQRRFEPFTNGDSNALPFSPRSIDSRTATSLAQMSNERELFERDLEAEDEDLPEGWEASRNREEEDFVKRLAKARAGIAVWTGNHIWWAVRNPLLLQLEAKIGLCPDDVVPSETRVDREAIFSFVRSIKDRDAKNELEFLTLSYLRQQAGLLLLVDFLNAKGKDAFTESEAEELAYRLVDSSLDPRVVLSLIPGLRNEIVESRKGIWIFGGVRESAARYLQNEKVCGSPVPVSALDQRTLQFLRKFLAGWRVKKGFGSIADENDVFRTVDASLLLILLELDQHTPKGAMPKKGSVRADLNDIVDRGVDCFDRAVDLLESYRRLFVLSRLYQSRKMAGEVLDTWRRIVEGEPDDGGELTDGEQRVREYLTKISNQGLVRTYGVWLANRDPKLGAQVFAEDKGRAPRFDPAHAVAILRDEAPDAVKYYLEHLVFGKGSVEYVDELIAYYLDIAVDALQSSQERRDMFAATYEAYRALQPPKPAYSQFLADNTAEDDEVSRSRLRLLQLLSDVRSYDAEATRKRLAAVPDELLVPEIIILDGREGNHENALRLLVHKLGDYDAAVRYCLRGGSSLFGQQQQQRQNHNYHHQQEGPPSQGMSRPLPRDEQCRLFKALLGEFLRIDHPSDRVEQTSGLLERFGPWFDVMDVIRLIPDDWSVRLLANFLEGALKRLVRERNLTRLLRGFSAVENLRVEGTYLEKVAEMGPRVDGELGGDGGSMGGWGVGKVEEVEMM
ncbi:hypothetical protein jhhlp_001824 [Lomentospora prolificans]|uniref:CNH domain-containing protein n=1 Tax=Lomentospora prolificans TaxID=41688 RepID=A0A2N3NGV7_9PEZI|nr:hypothetical protein jhhlp_001824 [Lomentospora prolificans]